MLQTWQVHRLYEVDEDKNIEPRPLGGAIVGLSILKTVGGLDSVEVRPREGPGNMLLISFGDRVVSMDIETAAVFVELMQISMNVCREDSSKPSGG